MKSWKSFFDDRGVIQIINKNYKNMYMNTYVFIRDYLSCVTCFRFIFRVNKHVLMYIVSFYDDLSIQSCHNVFRFMMMCKINMLKSWWKYNSHVFIRDCLSYKTCFRFIFRVDKHVLMYIVLFYDDLSISIQLYHNKSRSMMMCKIKITYWNHDENMIYMCSSGITDVYHIKHVFSSF